MKWFFNLTTRRKLFLAFGILMLSLASVIAVSYQRMAAINLSETRLYEEYFRNAVDVMKLRSSENGVRAALLSFMQAAQGAMKDKWRQEVGERSADIDALIRQLVARNSGNPQLLGQVKEFRELWEAFKKTRDEELIPLVLAGKTEDARAIASGIQETRNARMRQIANGLVGDAVSKAEASVAEGQRESHRTMDLLAVLGAGSIVLALAMALILNRVISGPLSVVSAIAERVTAGDLTVEVPNETRTDEIGNLMRAMHKMVESLQRTIRGIHESIEMLASSSSEILATTAQVASGAAETATAVSQTTATVEEVKQTAQVAAQKAKYVSDNAQQAAEVSQTGRESVEASIERMRRIQEQMESIAESIVRLSEQGQAIGEIIATVNDLAEQSNLLAVNAAIEASKAGEQGKGFAVVAQEVKSLAEQSKQATAQVRGILGDIQKATGTAVLATEQGSKAVESGMRQSEEAGESIRLLSERIVGAAQAATQIAASSQQQMVGMDQVALAMENIKQASSQNVAGTKQTETAAHDLHQLGQKLKQMVA